MIKSSPGFHVGVGGQVLGAAGSGMGKGARSQSMGGPHSGVKATLPKTAGDPMARMLGHYGKSGSPAAASQAAIGPLLPPGGDGASPSDTSVTATHAGENVVRGGSMKTRSREGGLGGGSMGGYGAGAAGGGDTE